jgi:dihydroorotate dehydrogenase (fumarate)
MNKLLSHYLGMELKSPLVASASPLTAGLKSAKELEDAGIGAIVMRSLFEEHCQRDNELIHKLLHDQDIGHFEASGYLPTAFPEKIKTTEDRYLETLQTLKSSLSIPVIASLNGVSPEGWEEHSANLQQAGADALELNIYYVAANLRESAAAVEQRYIDIVKIVRDTIDIPIAVKISSQFSSPVNFVDRLKMAGANAVVLFNRFYQPDINLETLDIDSHIQLSTSTELLERIRWTAILKHQVDINIAVTGGIHTVEDVIKASLAGANITQICSVLLKQGVGVIPEIEQALRQWLDLNEYDSLEQLRGSMSYHHTSDPAGYERANYLDMLDGY